MFSFLSVEFCLLFIGFFIAYWSLRAKPQLQNVLLLIFSYIVIYAMSSGLAIGILFGFSVVIFSLAYFMDRWQAHKKKFLISAIVATVIQLSIFKYYDFFKPEISQSLQALHLDSSGLAANLVLPIGLSYYSFQAISYLVSRYRNSIAVPRFNFIQLLMHFSFFATITAGPIARAESAKGLTDIENKPCGLSEQICQKTPRKLLYPTVAFFLLALALLKKWWIAGWLADNWVNPVFANPMQYHSLEILSAIYGYTLQLFLDFSGYSEMMIAFGLLLGFRLPVNFKAPLLAHNIRDFWDKWHISLSTWIRDYIYIPLGGSRGSFSRTQFNLVAAMVLSGIWHGSGWNFFLWGLLHGLALVALNISDKIYAKVFNKNAKESRNAIYNSGILGRIISVFVTINYVCFCFVFFRAKSLDEALGVFHALLTNYTNVQWNNNPFYALSLFLLAWVIYPFVRKGFQKRTLNFATLPKYRLALPLFALFMFIVICAPSGIPGFIYANF